MTAASGAVSRRPDIAVPLLRIAVTLMMLAPALRAVDLEDFAFDTDDAREWTHRVRETHGLTVPRPIALVGSAVVADVNVHITLAVDVDGRFRRTDATIEPSGALTGARTHILGGGSYRQVPSAPESLLDVARPRIEAAYRLACVTTLLRPPRGQRMTVGTLPASALDGVRVRTLVVARESQPLCHLYVRETDGRLIGWQALAETSAGLASRVVTVGEWRTLDGITVAVALRERTGSLGERTTVFTKVVSGDAAILFFNP